MNFVCCTHESISQSSKPWWETDSDIQLLREYLRIPSVHPNPDYGACVKFLQQQAFHLNLPVKIFHATANKKPIVLITWEGSDLNLSSILLNSHMDVVPVYPESWLHPPFAAEIDPEGRIYARGAQDMKSFGTGYLSAVKRLKRQGYQPKRTLHILYVPDEEIGSMDGMKAFAKTQEFRNLNIGFALDEGHVASDDTYLLFHGEKTIWQPTFTVKGQPGHGSFLLNGTAGEAFSKIIAKLVERRQMEVEKVNRGADLGNVTSINLTKVSGGLQTNVIPEELSVTFDIRLPPWENHDEFYHQLEGWMSESGNIEVTFEQKENHVPATPVDDTNPFWQPFKSALDELNFKFTPLILSGGTDMRFLRALGIPAYGFNPMNHTPILGHNHNEFIWADKYLKAIEAFEKIIEKLASFNG
ncbi:hypothetical protein DMENIID0001_047100 [Sergentomyia squamirostris]